MPAQATPTVVLLSKDQKEIKTTLQAAEKSVLIKDMVNDLGESVAEKPIHILEVNRDILTKVVAWCEHHRNDNPNLSKHKRRLRGTIENLLTDWDIEFFNVDQGVLFSILVAANYMDIQLLLDQGCQTVANIMKGKTTQEIRDIFHIANDFTPEEEAQIRKENEWAEDR